MKKETLARLIHEFMTAKPNGDLATHISELLELEKQIKAEHKKLRDEGLAMAQMYQQHKDDLSKKYQSLKLSCPHCEFSYHSAQYDSYYECDWCGYTW